MVIGFRGLDKLIRKFDEMGKVDVTPAILEATLVVQRRAKAMSPVDTGNLRGSIRWKIDNAGKPNVYGTVLTNVEYGLYQEFGTVNIPPHPFLRPALKAERKNVDRIVKEYIKKELRKHKV